MMAMDFFSNSSSVNAGLVGWGGGGVAAVSRFTVYTHTDTQNYQYKYGLILIQL